jgi:hypothetical protein
MKAPHYWSVLVLCAPLALLVSSCARSDSDADQEESAPAAEPASADQDDSDYVCRGVGSFCSAYHQCCSRKCVLNRCRL